MRSRADTIERVLIAGAVGLVALTARAFPETMELGSVLAVAALARFGAGTVARSVASGPTETTGVK
jgi:hypothetical protein